jgi:hypothetical protein
MDISFVIDTKSEPSCSGPPFLIEWLQVMIVPRSQGGYTFKVGRMNWIEGWLGVPDGGDGSELLSVLLAVTSMVTIVLVFSRRAQSLFLRLIVAIAPGVAKVHR